MEDLYRISKYISDNNPKQEEVYKILESYIQGACKRAWIRGWMRRAKLSHASKRSEVRALAKNTLLEAEDYVTDFSKPLPGKAVVKMDDDFKEVRYLCKGDVVTTLEGVKPVRKIKQEGNLYLIIV